ncbi:putative fimbrial subunit domain protein [Klebsiella pneumoniae VA360]|nr:putative fimbrial subunit domain protein [Klebsiella pneumoniae VA360]
MVLAHIKHLPVIKTPMTNILLTSGLPLFLVLPVFRVVRFMKRGLMGLGFRSPICYVVKMVH